MICICYYFFAPGFEGNLHVSYYSKIAKKKHISTGSVFSAVCGGAALGKPSVVRVLLERRNRVAEGEVQGFKGKVRVPGLKSDEMPFKNMLIFNRVLELLVNNSFLHLCISLFHFPHARKQIFRLVSLSAVVPVVVAQLGALERGRGKWILYCCNINGKLDTIITKTYIFQFWRTFEKKNFPGPRNVIPLKLEKKNRFEQIFLKNVFEVLLFF